MTQWRLFGTGGRGSLTQIAKVKRKRAAFFYTWLHIFNVSEGFPTVASAQRQDFMNTLGSSTPKVSRTTLRSTDGTSTELTTARRTHNRPIFLYEELWEVNRTYSHESCQLNSFIFCTMWSDRGLILKEPEGTRREKYSGVKTSRDPFQQNNKKHLKTQNDSIFSRKQEVGFLSLWFDVMRF